MKNSEQYFRTVSAFIEGAEEISAEYDGTVRRMEAFKGSEGYTREIQAAEQKRKGVADVVRAAVVDRMFRP